MHFYSPFVFIIIQEGIMNHIIQALKRYKILKAEIKNIELDIEELHEAENIGPSGISYEERSTATNKFSSITENQAIIIADQSTYLDRDRRAKIREVERIDNALSILNEKEREVLELKHIKGYRWDNVTYKIDRSYAQCKSIETEALSKIAPFFKNCRKTL
jgi:DNA-directed RNA polymerase specialized sigma24 family protein